MQNKIHSIPKQERLKGKKLVETFFAEHKSFTCFPIKVLYSFKSDSACIGTIRAGWGVSKKRFRRACHRNRIKRQLRETYRLQKPALHQLLVHQLTNNGLLLFFLYLDKEMTDSKLLQKKMHDIVQKLALINA